MHVQNLLCKRAFRHIINILEMRLWSIGIYGSEKSSVHAYWNGGVVLPNHEIKPLIS